METPPGFCRMTLEYIVAIHSITNRESLRFCELVRGLLIWKWESADAREE